MKRITITIFRYIFKYKKIKDLCHACILYYITNKRDRPLCSKILYLQSKDMKWCIRICFINWTEHGKSKYSWYYLVMISTLFSKKTFTFFCSFVFHNCVFVDQNFVRTKIHTVKAVWIEWSLIPITLTPISVTNWCRDRNQKIKTYFPII